MAEAQGANAGGTAGGAGTPFRVFQSEDEFQAEINAAEARARNKAERALKGQVMAPEDREELDRLRAADKSRQEKEAEAKGEWDRLKKSMSDEHAKALGERDAKLARATGELQKERIRRALVSAAAKANAIDPEEVADLLERRCRLTDEFWVEVLDEQGQKAYRGAEGMTPEQLVDAYLGKKPHLVRPGSTGQGGGSTGGASVSGRTSESPDLAKARADLAKADEAARKSGLMDDAIHAQSLSRKVKELEAAAART